MVDVIKTGKYTILMSKDDKWQADLISKSSIPEFKTLWREMSFNHKLLYVDDLQQGIEKLKQNPRFILFGPYEVLSIFASIECEIVMLEEQILPVYLAIPMRQNSPYTSYFSKRIKQYKEFGLISKWFDDYKAYVSSRILYLIMEYLTCFGTALMSVHMKTRNNSQIRSDVKLATFSVNSNEPRQPISTILLDEVTNK
uniref:Uncharacterized protein n=1 Tax=Panagrolaimus sp. JU765 TaxID=591449 RepID=A0AC34RET4_9BILA